MNQRILFWIFPKVLKIYVGFIHGGKKGQVSNKLSSVKYTTALAGSLVGRHLHKLGVIRFYVGKEPA